MRYRQLPLFFRSLGSMLAAGLPIDTALRSIGDQTLNPAFRPVVRQLCAETERGNPLSTGCRAFPDVFERAWVGMIQAAETGGRLAETLEQIAALLEERVKLRRQVLLAMIYPSIVLVMALAVGLLMILFVLPGVAGMYGDLEAELPAPTRALLRTAEASKTWGLVGALVLVGIIAGRVVTRRTAAGRVWLDWLALQWPIFGPLNRKIASARFARAYGQMLRSGVPVLKALELAGDVTGNTITSQILLRCRDQVEQGKPLSEALAFQTVFPPMLRQMIESGEQSGHIDEMMTKTADYYDQQVKTALTALTIVMIPLLVVVLGVLVAWIALAVLMPIFQLPNVIHV